MARLRSKVDYNVPEALLTFDPAVWATAEAWIRARERWLEDNGWPPSRPGQDPDTPFGQLGDRLRASHEARVIADAVRNPLTLPVAPEKLPVSPEIPPETVL